MKASAICPGSCGELIQGIIGERELLVSYPVNLYSRVTLIKGAGDMSRQGLPKARRALQLTFEYFGVPGQYSHDVQIVLESKIPAGKGMASSTADIGSVIVAAASLLQRDITPHQVVDIALKVEPTDSILFDTITLFDPVEGKVRESLGQLPPMKVVVLEGKGMVDTLEFRKSDYTPVKLKYRDIMEKALGLVRQGIGQRDCMAIGKAAIMSALANQEVLKKERLERIIDRAISWGAAGVNVAHSGTVVGILIDPRLQDPYEVLYKVREERLEGEVERVYCLDIVKGSAIIL